MLWRSGNLVTFDSFWRPNQVPVRVCNRETRGESTLERLWLLVLDRPGRDGRPADRRHQRRDLRSRYEDFHAELVRGGNATLRVEKLDDERIVLDVNLSQSAGAQRPFAALRSMFVSEGNSDVARIGWRTKDSQLFQDDPVREFKRASASELWGASCPRGTTPVHPIWSSAISAGRSNSPRAKRRAAVPRAPPRA